MSKLSNLRFWKWTEFFVKQSRSLVAFADQIKISLRNNSSYQLVQCSWLLKTIALEIYGTSSDHRQLFLELLFELEQEQLNGMPNGAGYGSWGQLPREAGRRKIFELLDVYTTPLTVKIPPAVITPDVANFVYCKKNFFFSRIHKKIIIIIMIMRRNDKKIVGCFRGRETIIIWRPRERVWIYHKGRGTIRVWCGNVKQEILSLFQ